MAKKLTSAKAKEILKDGTVHGHKLTAKQKKYFGYIAGGGIPKAQDGTRIGLWQDYMSKQSELSDPMEQLKKIQSMKIPLPEIQDYGVEATDPAAELTKNLGTYDKNKPKDINWGNVGLGALLLTNFLLPEEQPKSPVVRPQVSYNQFPDGTGSQAIAKSGIHIKPSKRGTLHDALGIPRGEKIPVNRLTIHEGDSPALKKKKQFAINARKWHHGENGLTVSMDGYKKNSKDKNKKSLRIPSSDITMQDVEFPVLGISDTGHSQLMFPGQDYSFDGSYVDEFPIRAQMGANVVGTPEQREKAVLEAQRIAYKQGLMDPANMQIGKYLPQYIDANTGKPYVAPPQKPLPTTVPSYIKLEDIKSEQGIYWYEDPQTGYTVDVDPSVVNLPRFHKPKGQVALDSLKRPSIPTSASLKKGGTIPGYNNGGSITPLTEDTIQFNGPSHADGGIKMAYGNQGVEVEGGETAFKSPDGSLNIMGNMINPLTGRKFKEDSKRLAKKEQKIDKLLDYSLDLVNTNDPRDKWELLKFNAGTVQMEGAAKKKIELQQSKQHLADLQNLMLEEEGEKACSGKKMVKAQKGWRFEGTKKDNLDPKIMEFVKLLEQKGYTGRSGKESGVSQRNTKSGRKSRHASGEALDAFFDSPDAYNKVLNDPELSKFLIDNGLTVINEYDPNTAKKTGATAGHLHIGYDKGTEISDKFRREASTLYKNTNPGWGWGTFRNPKGKTIQGAPAGDMQYFEEVTPPVKFNPNKPTFPGSPAPNTVTPGTYDTTITDPTAYYKPTNARRLGFTQVLPEFYAAATNQVEPVFMQEFTPELYQPYQVSFQDRLNENQASFSALSKAAGDNPAALATLAGQKYSSDSQVLADEFRTNQAIEQDVINKNKALLNDAELKNLQLADTQYIRQSQAKSKTKLQNQTILQSLSDKYKQNQLENRTLQVYENLYPNYYFDENYRTTFTGPKGQEFINWGSTPQTNNDAQVTIKQDNKGNIRTEKRYPSTIQKDLLNLQLNTKKIDYNKAFMDYLKKNR